MELNFAEHLPVGLSVCLVIIMFVRLLIVVEFMWVYLEGGECSCLENVSQCGVLFQSDTFVNIVNIVNMCCMLVKVCVSILQLHKS